MIISIKKSDENCFELLQRRHLKGLITDEEYRNAVSLCMQQKLNIFAANSPYPKRNDITNEKKKA